MSAPPTTAFDVLAGIVRERRTSMFVDLDRPVDQQTIAELCSLAAWAPCHKRTWPWRFASFTGDGRRRLGATAAEAMQRAGADASKVDKTRTKYLRAPALLVVGSVPGGDDVRTAENRDATAAAVQNLLLGATALGLASYWSSCTTPAQSAVARLAGFEPGTTIVAMVYLGWPLRGCPVPDRPPVELTHIS
ncbi:MAG: nitroreductase family protein [Actinobacteria bacterium]|nr:nitroreductase family protein [Actinomycetota bacterium]